MEASKKKLITLRPPKPEDAPQTAAILFEAFLTLYVKHNVSPPEFTYPLALSLMTQHFIPHATGFVAEVDGQVVGSNFLHEESVVSGVGPISVSSECQTAGVGRKLMEAVIERGKQVSKGNIRLCQDAFNMTSLSLYTRLGFETKESLVLLGGVWKGSKVIPVGYEVRPLTEADVPACNTLCQEIYGFKRAEVESSVKYTGRTPFVALHHGQVVAYICTTQPFIMSLAGARNHDDFEALIIGAASHSAGGHIGGLCPLRDARTHRFLLSGGLRSIKCCNLMAMGEYTAPRLPYFPTILF